MDGITVLKTSTWWGLRWHMKSRLFIWPFSKSVKANELTEFHQQAAEGDSESKGQAGGLNIRTSRSRNRVRSETRKERKRYTEKGGESASGKESFEFGGYMGSKSIGA